MSFQNKSGGIVLDAVITDVGRKHMARGTFKVTKFALGDDEVDYSLIISDGSGPSARFISRDTSPILEASAAQTATITYGLLSFGRDDILYMPTIKINTKLANSATSPDNEVYYICANKETSKKLLNDLGNRSKYLINNEINDRMLIVETGLDCHDPDDPSSGSDVKATLENKKNYILNLNMYDNYYIVMADNRFIESVYSSPADSIHRGVGSGTGFTIRTKLSPLEQICAISLPTIDNNFEAFNIIGVDNEAYAQPYSPHYPAGRTEDYMSMHTGPKSTIFGLNFGINHLLTSDSSKSPDFRYSKFGTINFDLFGSGNLYDFIETTIYIEATTSRSRLQIPLRIIRFSGT